jgi:hypothetical protein
MLSGRGKADDDDHAARGRVDVCAVPCPDCSNAPTKTS